MESPLFFNAGDKLLKKAHKVMSSKSKEDFQEFNAQFPIYDYLDGDWTYEKFAVIESINLKIYGGKSGLSSDELFVHLHHEVSDYMHYLVQMDIQNYRFFYMDKKSSLKIKI